MTKSGTFFKPEWMDWREWVKGQMGESIKKKFILEMAINSFYFFQLNL